MSDDERRPAVPWPLAIWLLPADDDAGPWQSLVDALADRLGSPRFEAHLTLHLGTCTGVTDPVPALQASAATAPPIVLEAAATDHSPHYFRTLFVPFPGPAAGRSALHELRARLVRAWRQAEAAAAPAAENRGPGAESSAEANPSIETAVADDLAAYRLDPHLSLLYARIEAPARAALALAHDLAGRRVRFDRLAFVRPSAGFTDLSEVDRWQVFGHCRLGEANITAIGDHQEHRADRS